MGINWFFCEGERERVRCGDNYIAACRAARAALHLASAGTDGIAVSARGYSGKGSSELFLAGFGSRTVNVYGRFGEKLPNLPEFAKWVHGDLGVGVGCGCEKRRQGLFGSVRSIGYAQALELRPAGVDTTQRCLGATFCASALDFGLEEGKMGRGSEGV